MKTTHSLCPECSACPELLIGDDGTVSLGEDEQWITLEPRQWNELVRLIRSGEVGEVIG
jgi:hypothetical protein